MERRGETRTPYQRQISQCVLVCVSREVNKAWFSSEKLGEGESYSGLLFLQVLE